MAFTTSAPERTPAAAYWAADRCHYTPLADGTWQGDQCVINHVDAGGTTYPAVFDFYTFSTSAATHRGSLQYQLDLGDPDYVAVRVPSSPIFQTALWVRQQRGNPNASIEFELHDPTSGQNSWWTLAQMEALTAPTGNTASPNTVTIGGDPNPAFASLGTYRGSITDGPFDASIEGPTLMAGLNETLTLVRPTCYYTVSADECH